MGFFEMKQKFQDAKKKKLINKLAIEEERNQKRYILNEREEELTSLRNQIKEQQNKKNFDFNKVGKASVGIAKGIGKASVGITTSIGSVLGKMAENKEEFEKKQKKKLDDNSGFF